jgi:hypothetical protein
MLCVYVHEYHLGWKSGKFRVKSLDCTHSKSCHCTNRTCTANSCDAVSACENVRIEGFDQLFLGTFKNPPKVDDLVQVIYDPKNRSSAMLMVSDHVDGRKKLIIGLILFCTTLPLVIAIIMYKYRKNAYVQGIGFGEAAVDAVHFF